jgi:hypothetical protein
VVETFERISAVLWVLIAAAGLLIRIRRLWILSRLVYSDPKDQAYLRTVIVSSVLRGIVKLILLVGGLLALSTNPTVPDGNTGIVFWIWRSGLVIALILLLVEDLQVDQIRRRLGTLETIRRGHAS